MALRWLIERYAPEGGQFGMVPIVHDAVGYDGYLKLLSTDDVQLPGRIKSIAIEGFAVPVMVDLTRNEILSLVLRRSVNPDPALPVYCVIGAIDAHTRKGRYLFVAVATGAVRMSSDSETLPGDSMHARW